MSKITEYNHKNIADITVSDLDSLNPDKIDVSVIKKTASMINKELSKSTADLYKVCVTSRQAMNTVVEMIRVVSRMNQYYKTRVKEKYSIAKIDKAADWFEENQPDIKLTDGMRSAYAERDVDYIDCKEKESASYALLEYLKNKLNDFEQDLNLAKKKMQIDQEEERYSKD